jgi:uncharacterized protein with PQ loop repeat
MLPPTLRYPHHWMFLFNSMGWLEYFCDFIYCIPQLIKNRLTKRADAISPIFLILAMISALCDSMSAWCLNWGPSSLYGAPIAIVLHGALLIQWYLGMKKHTKLNLR